MSATQISIGNNSPSKSHNAGPIPASHTHTHTMKTHVTIAFSGNFRPLHVEAETLHDAVKQACKRVSCPDITRALKGLHKDLVRQRDSGISLVSACSEHGGLSVRIADGARDAWLDSITDSMPENLLLTY